MEILTNKISENKEIILSVIVPVYNTEKYLVQCIESIMAQTYHSLEIILVDDGSTDSSGEICDRYAAVDKRIHVIHQKNSGLLSARLAGVQIAQGKYVGFVDGDDWIMEDMYGTLISASIEDDCDIVSMGYTRYEKNQYIETDDASVFGFYAGKAELGKVYSKMMYDLRTGQRGLHPSLCTKIIKKSLIMEELSKIDKRISLGEDAAIFYSCCLHANSLKSIQEYKYYYRMRDESMCHAIKEEIFEKVNYFNQYMRTVLTVYDEKYFLLNQLNEYIWTFLEMGLSRIFSICVDGAYSFPYALLEQDCNIILYGAGKVGEDYYSQLQRNDFCHIVAWMDKKKNYYNELVVSPDKIRSLEYEKVVIAVKKKEVAEEIIEELMKSGVKRSKIIWEPPFKSPYRILFQSS